jgi:hypothetical protein
VSRPQNGPTNGAGGAAARLADQAGLDIGVGIPGARSLDITRAYVRPFFDQHLRSKPQPLPDQPSRRYLKVTFCSPGGRLARSAPAVEAVAAQGRRPHLTPWVVILCDGGAIS